jgi:hypothetical protein
MILRSAIRLFVGKAVPTLYVLNVLAGIGRQTFQNHSYLVKSSPGFGFRRQYHWDNRSHRITEAGRWCRTVSTSRWRCRRPGLMTPTTSTMPGSDKGDIEPSRPYTWAGSCPLWPGLRPRLKILGEYQGGDGDDRHQIARMMMSRWLHIPGYEEDGDGSAERFEATLRAKTRGLVHRRRDKIERVAAALLVQRTLTAEQVEAVMQE